MRMLLGQSGKILEELESMHNDINGRFDKVLDLLGHAVGCLGVDLVDWLV